MDNRRRARQPLIAVLAIIDVVAVAWMIVSAVNCL